MSLKKVLETQRSRIEELLQVADQAALHSLGKKLKSYLKRQFKALGANKISITHQEITDD